MPEKGLQEWRMPFGNCPGRAIWAEYAGKSYLVFVDESIFMFFEPEMSARTGYFCHSAVGIPEGVYEATKESIKSHFLKFHEISGLSSFEDFKEFKYSSFKRADLKHRRWLALAIRDLLAPQGLFVAGFFTPVRSQVLEEIRTILLLGKEGDKIPDDYMTSLYPRAVAELKRLHGNGPGKSGLLTALMLLAVVSAANLLASIKSPFRVVYDPREKREDKAVRIGIEEYIKMFDSLKNQEASLLNPFLNDYFLGMSTDKSSQDEIGLQIADLMVGEVVTFFESKPELMSYKANQNIVTQSSKEPNGKSTFVQINGALYKDGTLHEMPVGLRNRFLSGDKSGRNVFHYFSRSLASGVLTCYSSWGQPRDLMPFDRKIWDQID